MIGQLAFADCSAAGESTSPLKPRVRRGAQPYPPDEAFLAALSRMPPSGGIALGVDRLLMILADADSLDGVLPFRNG